MAHRDADPAEMIGVADPGQLQDIRRPDGAGRQDHLARCPSLLPGIPGAVAGELDADRAGAVEQHAMHQRAGDDLQIGPLCRRPQISARGTLPAPAAAGLLHPADIVAGARRQVVHVGMIFEADLGPGLDHRLAQQRLVGGVGGQQRPAMAVKLVLPALPALGLFEIGQDDSVAPTTSPVAELAPMVEILGLAADIDHAVDRARSAKHPAAGIGDRPPIGAGIGLGGEAPGDRRMVEQLHVPGGDVDQRVAVAPAGFDQHDTGTGILAEPVGQDAAGRARTDNDVIRFHRASVVPPGTGGSTLCRIGRNGVLPTDAAELDLLPRHCPIIPTARRIRRYRRRRGARRLSD